MKSIQLPKNITFQWHITDQCNLRCQHCYQDDYSEKGLPLEGLLNILNMLRRFVEASKKENGDIKAHINFTGGEPFIHKNFLELLRATKEMNLFSFGILSNGKLLSQEGLMKLQTVKPSFIQLSVEGNRAMNDDIRGKGALKQVAKALKVYRELGIYTLISFTANAINYKQFPEVVRFAHKNKVNKLWTDRYLPCSKDDPLRLTVDQTKDFFRILAEEQKRHKYRFFSKTNISAHRALQFLNSGGKVYSCTAGKTLLTIMPQGEIYPCRRLPILVGNVLRGDLVDVYKNNPTLNQIREPEKTNKSCGSCYYETSCKGGLKCLSYIEKGDFHAQDPGCWL